MEDWPLIGVRFALYMVVETLFGLAAFGLYALRRHERAAIDLRRWLTALALLGLLLSFGWLDLVASAMAGTPRWPIDRAAIVALLAGSVIGTAWTVRVVALATAVIAARFVAHRTSALTVVALASATALATFAWAGHGAMGEEVPGWWHLAADIVHLLAAGAWIGALLALVLLAVRRASTRDATDLDITYRALHGFGVIGTILVGTIVATGLVSGWALVGFDGLASLGASRYGQLLLVKLGLFAGMLGLAALNRFRLTPAFRSAVATSDTGSALRALRRSLAVEVTVAVVILALVAWLGTLEPPA